MANPVFFDPKRRRWGRLRVLFDVLGIIVTTLILFFVVTVFFLQQQLPHLLMPEQKRNWRTLKEQEHRKKTKAAGTHRKTQAPPSQVALNSDEGIRAAFYVDWDAASFVSLKEYYPQIDILF